MNAEWLTARLQKESQLRLPGFRKRYSPEEFVIATRIALPHEQHLVRLIRAQGFATVRSVYRPLADALPVEADSNLQHDDIFASISDCVVGTMGIAKLGSDLRMSGLAVLPSFRKRGVASSLVAHANRVAEESDCDSIRLFTIRETGNIAIFARLGFEIVAETIADWCVSDRFCKLHDTEMVKKCG